MTFIVSVSNEIEEPNLKPKPIVKDVKTTFWYYLRNNGDGTGTPVFCDSVELASLMEELQDEGWGDSCIDSIDMWATSKVHLENVLTFDEAIADEYHDAFIYLSDLNNAEDYFDEYSRWFLNSLYKLRQLEELQASIV
jgi:hypothetical protein